MSKPDEPTAAITRGLSGLLAALSTFEVTTSERFGDWTEDEELALDWLRMWVDAGAAMLPRDGGYCAGCGDQVGDSTWTAGDEAGIQRPICRGCHAVAHLLEKA